MFLIRAATVLSGRFHRDGKRPPEHRKKSLSFTNWPIPKKQSPWSGRKRKRKKRNSCPVEALNDWIIDYTTLYPHHHLTPSTPPKPPTPGRGELREMKRDHSGLFGLIKDYRQRLRRLTAAPLKVGLGFFAACVSRLLLVWSPLDLIAEGGGTRLVWEAQNVCSS